MKRILLISGLLLSCLPIIAQNKGEMYVGLATGFSFATQKTTTSSGALSRTESQPLGYSFSFQAEYAYFVVDNLRLSLAVGVPFSASPLEKVENTWLYSKTVGFEINPNIAYYVRITDWFSYTPEVGFAYEVGSYKEDMESGFIYNMTYNGYTAYVHLLAFEFRVCPRFALGVMAGNLSYDYVKLKEKGSTNSIGTGRFSANIDSGGIAARIYF